MPKPMMLIVLDGWGERDSKMNNAIFAAKKPNWDQLWQQHTHTLISGSGMDVGLPGGQMGNSEVGHLNLGAGRVVYQELTRIDKAIAEGEFFNNSVLLGACQQVVETNKALHVCGLLSDGGVHSHERHIAAMMKLAAQTGVKQLYFHAFLDGRDTPPRSAANYLSKLQHVLEQLQVGRIASLVGRYYAMDRDKRWERVEQAYNMLAKAEAEFNAPNAAGGLAAAYARGETDEFVKPTIIGEPAAIQDGDSIVFMNFRADRARQLSHAFVDDSFTGFSRPKKLSVNYITLTEYEAGLAVQVAYRPGNLHNVLGEYLANQGLKQLRIAETEKYAHVTFFFNGGVETPFAGEDRVLIPSPRVATYDLQPEMSAPQLTDKLVEAIQERQYDVIICNYANADMVGHTGNFAAAVKAIETIDSCLGKVVGALQQVGGEVLITADHGNAEKMLDEATGQPHTAHTSDPVPLLYVGRKAKVLVQDGVLSDVAPTMLYLMGLPVPAEMSGRVLFKLA